MTTKGNVYYYFSNERYISDFYFQNSFLFMKITLRLSHVFQPVSRKALVTNKKNQNQKSNETPFGYSFNVSAVSCFLVKFNSANSKNM